MSADRLRRAARAIVAVPIVLLASCSWFTDFKQQPKIDPWESVADSVPPRADPQNSVRITGTQLAGYQISRTAAPGVIDSIGRAVTNPTPISPASLANGRKYYEINCVPCHGAAGLGNGPAVQYGMAGINLVTDVTRNRSDGYIWGMMRNGRGIMPPYNRIEEMDRWDVVNYVRALQGRAGVAADTTPIGFPGQTGDHLPGFTRLGPTRPVPYYHPGRGAVSPLTQPEQTVPAGATSPAGAGATPSAAASMTDSARRTPARRDSAASRVARPEARP